MSTVEFKVGDFVNVLGVAGVNSEHYQTHIIESPFDGHPLAVEIPGGFICFDYDGSNSYNRTVVGLVEATEPVEAKDSKTVIAEMLKDYKYVLCYLSDSNKTPNDMDYMGNVSSMKYAGFFTDHNGWKYATPIDPKTGERIIDYRDGFLIVEN